MSNTVEIKVPNIGDFKDVEVIEILVKPGDSINAEDSLISVESDKASMEIPAPQAGVVKDVLVKIGDKVSEGSPILMLESGATATTATKKAEKPAAGTTQALRLFCEMLKVINLHHWIFSPPPKRNEDEFALMLCRIKMDTSNK